MKPLPQLQDRATIIDVVRDYLGRHRLAHIDGKTFSKIIAVLRRYDRNDFDEVLTVLIKKNPQWLETK